MDNMVKIVNYCQYLDKNKLLHVIGESQELHDHKLTNFIHFIGFGAAFEEALYSGPKDQEKKDQVVKMISEIF